MKTISDKSDTLRNVNAPNQTNHDLVVEDFERNDSYEFEGGES